MISIDAKQLRPKVGHLYKVHGLMDLRYVHGWSSPRAYQFFENSTVLVDNDNLVLVLGNEKFIDVFSADRFNESTMIRVLVMKPHINQVTYLRSVDFCDELFQEITQDDCLTER